MCPLFEKKNFNIYFEIFTKVQIKKQLNGYVNIVHKGFFN